MNSRRSCRLLVVSTACLLAAACGASQPEPELSVWTARYDLPDGRCFVTDGRLLLEASYLPELKIPERSLPAERAERLLARDTDKEFTFGDLKCCDAPPGQCAVPHSHYRVGDIVLHWVYVDLLR